MTPEELSRLYAADTLQRLETAQADDRRLLERKRARVAALDASRSGLAEPDDLVREIAAIERRIAQREGTLRGTWQVMTLGRVDYTQQHADAAARAAGSAMVGYVGRQESDARVRVAADLRAVAGPADDPGPVAA